MYVVYAFGNGYLLSNMFMAISSFFANGDTYALLEGLVLISYIFLLIRVIVTGNHFHLKTMFMYTGGFAVVYLALISVQVNVNVQDISNPGSPTNAQVISHVPIGIAEPWSLVTTAQYALAQDFQNTFSVPNGDNLLENGIGVSLMNDETNATISPSNSYLYEDYNMYIQNCVAPGIATGNINASTLFSAGNATDTSSLSYQASNAYSVWDVMSSYTAGAGANILTNWYSGTNPSSMTEQASGQSDPQGITTTCGQETVWIQSAVQDYINGPLMNSMAGALQFATVSELSNAIGSINPYIYNMQQSSMNMLYQSIGANMYSPAILKMAQISGANADSLAVATGTAVQSTTSGLIESGILAGKYMPIVFGLFEALMLGVCVILLILGITHLGHGYIKMMFQFLIMIMIWPSLVVIFNYISQLIIQAQFSGYSGLGYSIGSSGAISSYLSESLAWMGYFSWSVPMVAYAIASNSSYAMVSMVGGMESSITRNASIPGANALSKGDFEAGVVKDNMMTANSFNATHQASVGVGATGIQSAPYVTETTQKGINGTISEQRVDGHGVFATITQGQNTVSLQRQSDGDWEVTKYNGSLSAVDKKEWIEGVKKDLSSADKQELSLHKTASNSIETLQSAINQYNATSNGSVTRGKNRNAIVSSGGNQTNNQTVDAKSTADGSGGIGLNLFGLKLGVGFTNSNSLMNSTGNAYGSGVQHKIDNLKNELHTLTNSHNSLVAEAASKALTAVDKWSDSISKIKTYRQDLSEAKTGSFAVSGSVMPNAINNMVTNKGSLNSFASAFEVVNNEAASVSGIEGFISQQGSYDAKLSDFGNINTKISNGAASLSKQTNILTPTNFSNAYAGATNQGNGEFSNLNYEYSKNYNLNALSISSPIAGPGFISAQTASSVPHGNPLINNALRGYSFVANTADGMVNGVLFGGIGGIGSINGNENNYFGLHGGDLGYAIGSGDLGNYLGTHKFTGLSGGFQPTSGH
ncbi:MAG: conjugal transfer protein TraG [Candidatus Acidulodesulfobacterium acidiphilum]|uniref:Conjugal transfer protein TraG n=1 Tax=Candidatus Acidulodesulfobacterium acidiphilum TaxID=2597224 RepID=A0A520XFP7_9DELT|nr:MAG: conjugal transfer protein TraG [Candidatus Acidulodesulfobacterium acidiphilum]